MQMRPVEEQHPSYTTTTYWSVRRPGLDSRWRPFSFIIFRQLPGKVSGPHTSERGRRELQRKAATSFIFLAQKIRWREIFHPMGHIFLKKKESEKGGDQNDSQGEEEDGE